MDTDVWCMKGATSHCVVVFRPVSVVATQGDTTYVFREKGSGHNVTIHFMKHLLHGFLRSLVGGQRLQDDPMDFIRQLVP